MWDSRGHGRYHCSFFGGLRHEIQDIVFHIEFYTLKHLFQLAMHAEKELQEIMDQKFARMDRIKNNEPSHIDYNHQCMRGKLTISSFLGHYDAEGYLN